MDGVRQSNGTLHFIGLLSDGNVHSHERHLHAMLQHASIVGIRRVRVHVLLDGRDVGERTAETYLERLDECARHAEYRRQRLPYRQWWRAYDHYHGSI